MKRIECEIECRPIGSYSTHIIVDDDATDEDIKAAAKNALGYYIYIGEPKCVDCSTCIHNVVCGVKPEDKHGCGNWYGCR